ncbi:MAG: type IV pili methyl-accepting chemotaxis transducer N-terminal domain-containing protein [Wolinella sp.]
MFEELHALLRNRHVLIRTLTRRHLYIFIAIFMLLFIAYISLQAAIERQKSDSYLINISGKQRMLSQRIVSLSQNIASRQLLGREFGELRDELKLSLQELLYIHQTLSEKVLKPTQLNSLHNSPLSEVYFGSWGLALKLDGFLRDATLVLSSVNPEDTLTLSGNLSATWEGEGGLLGILELGTLTFQLESERRVSTLQKIALGTAIFIVFLLVVEAFFVTRVTLLELADAVKNEAIKS